MLLVNLASLSSSWSVIGRHAVSADGEVIYDMPGVRIEATISGADHATAKMCQVGDVTNHFVVTVDGKRVGGPSTFDTASWPKGADQLVSVPLFNGSDPSATHTVVIEKSTEPKWNSLKPTENTVRFVGFDGPPNMKLAAPPLPKRRIEFLGDSITAGFCNLCDHPHADTSGRDPTPAEMAARLATTVDEEAFALSWPTLTCAALDAACHTAAWSGQRESNWQSPDRAPEPADQEIDTSHLAAGPATAW
jgi:hypothetical protein